MSESEWVGVRVSAAGGVGEGVGRGVRRGVGVGVGQGVGAGAGRGVSRGVAEGVGTGSQGGVGQSAVGARAVPVQGVSASPRRAVGAGGWRGVRGGVGLRGRRRLGGVVAGQGRGVGRGGGRLVAEASRRAWSCRLGPDASFRWYWVPSRPRARWGLAAACRTRAASRLRKGAVGVTAGRGWAEGGEAGLAGQAPDGAPVRLPACLAGVAQRDIQWL